MTGSASSIASGDSEPLPARLPSGGLIRIDERPAPEDPGGLLVDEPWWTKFLHAPATEGESAAEAAAAALDKVLGGLAGPARALLRPAERRAMGEEVVEMKRRIVDCHRHEKEMEARLETIAVELQLRKSRATVAVAAAQVVPFTPPLQTAMEGGGEEGQSGRMRGRGQAGRQDRARK